jgi:polysaccharide export outer membrane protein
MRKRGKILSWGAAAVMLLTMAWFVAGCGVFGGGNPADNPPVAAAGDIINVGDQLSVVFSDLPTTAGASSFDQRVRDDGTITLLLNQTFQAAGKTRSQLEQEIRARYVPTAYVKRDQYYYLDGEGKMPSRQPNPGEITVLKAIATAQGFTDFANKRKVRLTHTDGKSVIVDCEAAVEDSRFDLPVYPGDKIFVPRKLW